MIYVIPAIITFILISAIYKRLQPYRLFLEGAKEGMNIILGIFPPLMAILTAAYMLRASGTMDMFISLLSPLTRFIPAEVMPLAMIRPLSGSGALGILTDILKNCGADSEAGRIASVIMGSTETTFYCICIYFAKTRVRHSLRAIPFAVIGDIVGLIMAVVVIKLLNF